MARRTGPVRFFLFHVSLSSFYFLTYMLTEKEPTIFQWRHRYKSVRVEGCEAARLAKCYVEAHQTGRIYSRGVTKHLCCPVVLRSCLPQARLLLICLFFHRFLSSSSSMLLRDTTLAFCLFCYRVVSIWKLFSIVRRTDFLPVAFTCRELLRLFVKKYSRHPSRYRSKFLDVERFEILFNPYIYIYILYTFWFKS